jgi:hypothetical protein
VHALIRASTRLPVAVVSLVLAAGPVRADNDSTSPNLDDEDRTGIVTREGKGITFRGAESRNSVHLWLRSQFRYSTPFEADPRTPADFATPPGGDFEVNRARLKAQGTILSPKLGYYFEHELAGDPRLLDLRLDLTQRENFRLRIGQYKVLYNRERVDSSGAQQFVERSIVTRAFTLDRQRGITAAGRIGEGRAFDAWYYVGLMEGDGRDPDASGGKGDGRMWLARYQWNLVGEPLKFSQSDFEFQSSPAATLAIATARFEGPYTRFSSDGGGQLDGFADGVDDQYAVEQWLQEFAWQYDGWSVQQEYHVKRIEDRLNGGKTRLNGYYVQVGKAWPWVIGEWTRPIELALRRASVDQNSAIAGDTQHETTLAFNLYLAGHDNKLTVDVSRLRLGQTGGDTLDDTRWRLQWDVSF